MTELSKQAIKHKIKNIVSCHAETVLQEFGFVIDQQKEINRIYAEFQANLISFEDIETYI